MSVTAPSGTPAGVTGSGTGTGSPTPSGGSPSPTPSSASPSSTGVPSSSGTPGSGQPSEGPVEYTRFKEVNDKYTGLRWAEEHDPQEVSESVQLRRWFDTDPRGAYDYVTGLMKRGGYLNEPAPRPSSPGGDQFTDPKSGRPLPDIIIRETGQRFYSADQAEALVEWRAGQLEGRIKTIEGRETVTDAQQEARAILNDAQRNWEGFSDYAEDIFKEMRRDKRITLETAYRRVVVPKIGQLKRQALMAEANERANAGTGGLNPGAPAPSSTADLRKLPLTELFSREMTRRGFGRR